MGKNKIKKVIVIGSGLGGMCTALLLAKKGFDVTILEKNSQTGGRIMQKKTKGFTFDMGPSWFMMPEVFETFFAKFDKKLSDVFTLKRLDPHYRVFYSDGDVIDIKKNLEINLKKFEELEKGSSDKIRKYLQESKYKYDTSIAEYLYKNYYSLKDFFTIKLLFSVRKLHLFESWEKYTSRFVKNKKIQQILMYPVVFLGGSPTNTPALYSLLSHVDFSLGVFYPMGGIYEIAKQLEKLCGEMKVTIKKNNEVKQILVKDGSAVGVKTKAKTYLADIVVSNADYPFTEMKLLDKQWRTYDSDYWKKKTLAPSAFILYLGIKGKIKNVTHHNFYLMEDWNPHFADMFAAKKWPTDPCFYFTCATKIDPKLAPYGDDSLFVLVPIASGLKDTAAVRKTYTKKIITHIEEITKDTIHDRLLVCETHTLNDYKKLYNAYEGTALGLAHTLSQTAIFRPQNKSKKVSNVYFTGQYTVPGIGLPICIISAELVTERIVRDYGI